MTKGLFCSAAIALVTLIPAAAPAQQFYGMEYDQNVMAAINQMSSAFGGACQMGDQQACGSFQYVQNIAGYMWNASAACMQGDQGGCQAYQQAYFQLDQDYGQFNTYYQPPAMQPDYSMGSTHEERMQNIHNWGQQMLAQGDSNSALMDQRHEQFMSTLRQ